MSQNDPILVINGVETRLQVVLGCTEGIICSHEITAPGRIMPHLAPALDMMFKTSDIGLGDLRGIAAVRGPGSFTGVRLILATVLGLAKGKNLPTSGLDYLDILARLPSPLLSGELWVCTYARFQQVYLQGFSCPEGCSLDDVQAVTRESAVELIRGRKERVTLLGSGLRKDEGWWRAQLPKAALLSDEWDAPSTATLLAHALETPYDRCAIPPLYIRASDAEQNLAAIATARGLSESEARSHIPDFLRQQ